MPLYLPLSIGISVVLITYYKKLHAVKLDDELERRSLLVFGKNAEESHSKQTLKEFLDRETIQIDLNK
jgi:hypothetical protein